MADYILLIQGNETTATTGDEWERFFVAALESGTFRGGSEIGRREMLGDRLTARSTEHIVGYMRFEAEDQGTLVALLALHPVVLHGGSVELCELPKS